MKVTRQQMLEILPGKGARSMDFLHYINIWADTFGINNPMRMAHFLGQVLHETNGLRYTHELGDDKLFEKYEQGYLGKTLGNTQKGDGAKYKGRGLIMITGKANYKAYQKSKYCNGDVVNNPSLLESPCGATKSGMWWWKHGCNQLADKDSIVALTKKINGGLNGFDSRSGQTNAKACLACSMKWNDVRFWRWVLVTAVVTIAAISLTGCCSKRYVTVPEFHKEYVYGTDTVVKTDSVYVKDSVYVYRNGDTVMINKTAYRDRWHNIYKVKADTIIKRDSVPYPVVRELTKSEQRLMTLGRLFLVILIVAAVIWFTLLFYHNKKC